MIRYTPGLLTAHDGVQIAGYTWLPEGGRPRALVQIAHGAAEHALRYDRFAQHLIAHGYGVLATDLRGHGATATSTGGFGTGARTATAGVRMSGTCARPVRRPARCIRACPSSCSGTAWGRCSPGTTRRSIRTIWRASC